MWILSFNESLRECRASMAKIYVVSQLSILGNIFEKFDIEHADGNTVKQSSVRGQSSRFMTSQAQNTRWSSNYYLTKGHVDSESIKQIFQLRK